MNDDAGLAGSELLREVLKRIRPHAKAAVPKLQKMQAAGKYRNRGTTEYAPAEFYDVDVFRRCMAILRTFERLGDVQRFVRHVPSAADLRLERMDHARWIEYHYAYHVVLISSVYDQSLLLVNALLRLGYPERLATSDPVKNNRWTVAHSFAADSCCDRESDLGSPSDA